MHEPTPGPGRCPSPRRRSRRTRRRARHARGRASASLRSPYPRRRRPHRAARRTARSRRAGAQPASAGPPRPSLRPADHQEDRARPRHTSASSTAGSSAGCATRASRGEPSPVPCPPTRPPRWRSGADRAPSGGEASGRSGPLRDSPGRKSLHRAALPLLRSNCTSTARPLRAADRTSGTRSRDAMTTTAPRADRPQTMDAWRGFVAGPWQDGDRRPRLHPAQLHPVRRRRRASWPARPSAPPRCGTSSTAMFPAERERGVYDVDPHTPAHDHRRTRPATSTRTTS